MNLGISRYWTTLLAIALAVLIATMAYGATTNTWDTDPTGTGETSAQKQALQQPGCRWLNLVAGDTAGTFSDVLIVGAMGTATVHYDPDTTSDGVGAKVNIHTCIYASAAVGEGCAFLGKDRDGDGSIDIVPLDGTPGYTGMSFTGPVSAIAVEVVTAGAAHAVRVCAAR